MSTYRIKIIDERPDGIDQRTIEGASFETLAEQISAMSGEPLETITEQIAATRQDGHTRHFAKVRLSNPTPGDYRILSY